MEKSTRNLINEENSVYFPRGADWKPFFGVFSYPERITPHMIDKGVNHYALWANILLLATYNAVLTLPFYILAKEGLEKMIR